MEQTTTKSELFFDEPPFSYYFKALLSIQLYMFVYFDIVIVGQIT